MPAATRRRLTPPRVCPPNGWHRCRKAGILTVDALASAVPGKLHQELCGINKKFKLGLKTPSIDEVTSWIGAQGAENE